jgi:hypothetical protein
MTRLRTKQLTACLFANRAREASAALDTTPEYAIRSAALSEWSENYKTNTVKANLAMARADSAAKVIGLDSVVKVSVGATSRCEIATREYESYLR